jgi:alkyl sulfatase BDS1-like metallo-beta-lactamase superfamily hydrolase
MRDVFILLFASALLFHSCKETPGAKVENDTNNISKTPSSFTEASNEALMKYLNFTDTTDFQNAGKGFMGTVSSGEILHIDGSLSYSMKDFEFLKATTPNTANPSLWRESRLNSMNGLFQVADNIYQIRGFDLANMTLIKGKTGWLVIDPLTVPTRRLPGESSITDP